VLLFLNVTTVVHGVTTVVYGVTTVVYGVTTVVYGVTTVVCGVTTVVYGVTTVVYGVTTVVYGVTTVVYGVQTDNGYLLITVNDKMTACKCADIMCLTIITVHSCYDSPAVLSVLDICSLLMQ
jgi:hypothetical protein